MTNKQKDLFSKMADHTAPLCAGIGPGSCRVPHSCCDRMYCEDAISYAKEAGEVLKPSDFDPRLPLMGPHGCVAPPHLRPICTVHVCCINGAGFNAHDKAWTKRYFELRDKLEDVLVEIS